MAALGSGGAGLGTRDYVTNNGFRHVTLGLSGGIDSALMATVACDALGTANVTGVTMPSPYLEIDRVRNRPPVEIEIDEQRARRRRRDHLAGAGLERRTEPLEASDRGYDRIRRERALDRTDRDA